MRKLLAFMFLCGILQLVNMIHQRGFHGIGDLLRLRTKKWPQMDLVCLTLNLESTPLLINPGHKSGGKDPLLLIVDAGSGRRVLKSAVSYNPVDLRRLPMATNWQWLGSQSGAQRSLSAIGSSSFPFCLLFLSRRGCISERQQYS